MNKQPAGRTRGGTAVDATEVREAASKGDTHPPEEELAQTEAFTMNASSDDAAADFLLNDSEPEGGATEMIKAWQKAESKKTVKKPELKAAPRPEAKPQAKAEVKAEPKADLAQTEAMPAEANIAKAAPAETAKTASGQRHARRLPPAQEAGAGRHGGGLQGDINVKLEKEVALKVLSKDLAGKPAFVARFPARGQGNGQAGPPAYPSLLRCRQRLGRAQLPGDQDMDGGSVEDRLKNGRLFLGDALHMVLKTAEACSTLTSRS